MNLGKYLSPRRNEPPHAWGDAFINQKAKKQNLRKVYELTRKIALIVVCNDSRYVLSPQLVFELPQRNEHQNDWVKARIKRQTKRDKTCPRSII